MCRRSRCCCKPSLVGDSSTRSSTNSRHLISVSIGVMPWVADCSNSLASWLMYMLNRVGLKLYPCLTPRLCGKKSVFLSYLDCTFFVCVHQGSAILITGATTGTQQHNHWHTCKKRYVQCWGNLICNAYITKALQRNALL